MAEQLADKLAWILYFAEPDEPRTSATYFDEHFAAQIDADYAKIEKRVEAVKKLRQQEEAIRTKGAKSFVAHELGGEG